MDINITDIIISNVDTSIIDNAIKQRAADLSSQLNEEAAQQLIKDMGEIKCSVSVEGSNLVFKKKVSDSYLLNYLKEHGTPVSGGDNGIAHDVDGSVYVSNVPSQLQGTPLPFLELPVIQGEDEAQHIIELMARDATQDAANKSRSQIAERIKPYFASKIAESLGGD